MKALLRCMYMALVVFVMSSNLAGQTVVVNDNIEFVPDSSSFGASHRGTVIQDLFGDFTSVWFDYDGSSLTAVASNTDEGSDWYVVEPGDVFGPVTIARNDFPSIIGVPVFAGTEEFYLGVSTGTIDCSNPSCRDVFGWVRLRNVFGQLEMVENAVAYNSLGIIVGTTNLVPEPSSIALGWMALAGLTTSYRWPSSRAISNR